MKKIVSLIPALIYTLILCGMIMFINPTIADNPPPPPAHGQTGNEVPGGGAYISGGLIILTALGLGYGAKKYYNYKMNLAYEE